MLCCWNGLDRSTFVIDEQIELELALVVHILPATVAAGKFDDRDIIERHDGEDFERGFTSSMLPWPPARILA